MTIWGVPLSALLQAQQYAGMNITIRGGMKSLPGSQFQLYNPSQAGLLITGTIFQSFGNFVGTDMNISFVIVNTTYTIQQKPGNFVFQWAQGQSLEQAIANALTVAYPDTAVVYRIGSNYAPPQDIKRMCSSLGQLGTFVKSLTKTSTFQGVDVGAQSDGSIVVSDGSKAPSPIQIAFNDLIGQPKWIDPFVMQFSTVMRSDVQVCGSVLLPQGLQYVPGIVTTSAQALAGLPASVALKYQAAFQGEFIIQSVRHTGNFRDPDAASWSTLFQAFATGAKGASNG